MTLRVKVKVRVELYGTMGIHGCQAGVPKLRTCATLVIVWEDPKQILLIELTVPFESNITDARKRKIDK